MAAVRTWADSDPNRESTWQLFGALEEREKRKVLRESQQVLSALHARRAPNIAMEYAVSLQKLIVAAQARSVPEPPALFSHAAQDEAAMPLAAQRHSFKAAEKPSQVPPPPDLISEIQKKKGQQR